MGHGEERKTAGDVPGSHLSFPRRYMGSATTVKSTHPSFASVLLTVNAVFFIASSSLSFLVHMICGLVMIVARDLSKSLATS